MKDEIKQKYLDLIDGLPEDLETWRKSWIKDNWLHEFIYFDNKAVQFKTKNTRLVLTDKYSKSLGVILATYLASPAETHYVVSILNLVLMILIVYSTTTLAAIRPFDKHQAHRETAEQLMEEWRSFSVLLGHYHNLGWGDGFGLFHDRVTEILQTNRRRVQRIEKAANRNGKDSENTQTLHIDKSKDPK